MLQCPRVETCYWYKITRDLFVSCVTHLSSGIAHWITATWQEIIVIQLYASSISSFPSIQCNGFFSLFSCLCSFFLLLSFSISRISSFLSHNNFFVHPRMLLHPRTSHSSLLWVFSFHPFSSNSLFLLLWMSSSETCPCIIFYIPWVWTLLYASLPVSLLSCLILLSSNSFPFAGQSFKFNFTIFHSGSAGPQWAVIGSVAGIIVVVVIVVVVVSWWVHKQRKCRKDIKSK